MPSKIKPLNARSHPKIKGLGTPGNRYQKNQNNDCTEDSPL